jgi:energy-coupling factor transporter ATP-binding protein EcfA2
MDDFALPGNRAVKKLSRGMASAVGIVIGLAAHAEITLFDEPYLGLDAVARQIFYDRLLADYAEHPRTVLLSTHLIDEVANLLEHVVVIDRGRIVADPSGGRPARPGRHGQRPKGRRRRIRHAPRGAEPPGDRIACHRNRGRPARRHRAGQGARPSVGTRTGIAAGIRHSQLR